MVTHNEEVARYADYVVHIRDGLIVDIDINTDKLEPEELDEKKVMGEIISGIR
jgi:ABC-type lipoprotein export system ATPase subunit